MNKIFWILFSITLTASAVEARDFSIPQSTVSPDGRYGVIVPKLFPENPATAPSENLPVEMSSLKALATIQGYSGFDRMNHGGVCPSRWSNDSKLLVWEVYGKWTAANITLIELGKDKIAQFDLLSAGQKSLLKLTRAASPALYDAAKTHNSGSGSAYPEGFTVEVEILPPISFPLHFRANLNSNPKGVDDLPNLESWMEGTFDKDGKPTPSHFQLGHAPFAKF